MWSLCNYVVVMLNMYKMKCREFMLVTIKCKELFLLFLCYLGIHWNVGNLWCWWQNVRNHIGFLFRVGFWFRRRFWADARPISGSCWTPGFCFRLEKSRSWAAHVSVFVFNWEWIRFVIKTLNIWLILFCVLWLFCYKSFLLLFML